MRIKDFSTIKTKSGKLSFADQIKGSFQYGFSWPADIAAQEDFISILEKDADQRFSLLRNYPLKEVDVRVPLILIGPPGVLVISFCRKRGLYRARENQWLEMSGKKFKPAKENLIRRTQLYARAVQKVLQEIGHPDVNVDGLLAGMHPGITIDSQNPAVRALQLDALRYWSTRFTQEPPALSSEKIYQIVADLIELATKDEKAETEQEAARQKAAHPPKPDKVKQALAPVEKRLNFTTKQWAILGLLMFGIVAVLSIFILFIYLSY
ncbi:MAG TPA: hypothetical protein EYP88_08685 [Anaerolineales bacterium]|nr:hypothetical protein [Anaerolineales bacterium]